MNVRQRLNEAYENVQFNADKTWTNNSNVYQKSNMELYLLERCILKEKLLRFRPRTVRELIPNSKLAQYSNFVYDESREMSYAFSVSNGETRDLVEFSDESSWESLEVGELYKWFLKKHPEEQSSRIRGYFESPLLKVTGFEDKILKIHITKDRVKNIWKKDYLCGQPLQSNKILINLYTSPMNNTYLFNNENNYNHEWFMSLSTTKDFQQLEKLSNSLKEHCNSLSKPLTGNIEPIPNSASESTSSEILYSEVLQGLSPSRKLISSLKGIDYAKSLTSDEQPSTSHENFTNYTVLNSQRSAPNEPSSSSDNFNETGTTTRLLPQKTTTSNVYFQAETQQIYPRFKYQTQFSRTSILPQFSTSYVQQTYFYTPVQTPQRWIPPNFTSYYPTQIFTQSWYTQNPLISNVNRILGQTPVTTNSDNFNSQYFECARVEESHFKEEAGEFEAVVEEPQVSASISEELEIQALEQYSNSNENVYQELERQAAEQYANSPD